MNSKPSHQFSLKTLLKVMTAAAFVAGIVRLFSSWVQGVLIIYLALCGAIALALMAEGWCFRRKS
jgi:hypothetical protein